MGYNVAWWFTVAAKVIIQVNTIREVQQNQYLKKKEGKFIGLAPHSNIWHNGHKFMNKGSP